jgi:type IV pilus assembly protein PilO
MKNIDLKNIYTAPLKIRLVACAIVFLLVMLLGYQWDIASLRSKISINVEQEANAKQELRSVMEELNRLTHYTASFPELKITYNDWQNKIIQQTDLPELLNEMLKIAATNNLYVNLFNPGDNKKADLFYKLPIKMVVVGSYHQVADYISQLANLTWIVVVSNLEITSENKNDMLGTKLAAQATANNYLTAELSLEIYNQVDSTHKESAHAKTL